MTQANEYPPRGQAHAGRPARLTRLCTIAALLAAIAVFWSAPTALSAAELPPKEHAVDLRNERTTPPATDLDQRKQPLDDRIREFIRDAEYNCIRTARLPMHPNDQPMTDVQSSLVSALRLVAQSDVGDWLIRFAAVRDVTVCLDQATPLEAHYRSHLGLLGLSARLGPAGRVVFLAHELAHVPQHPRYSNNRRFSPADMLLLQRVREAAAEATATRVLWQLREKGIHEPWQEKLTTAYRDIAENFAAGMADNHGDAYELQASRSAFHHWFDANWRLEIYDDLMLTTLARIARDSVGLIPTSRHLTDHYIRGVADYAGQGFLIHGDGLALIESFSDRALPAGGQARLDAILAESSRSRHDHDLAPLSGETLSAVSPTPGFEAHDR